MLLLLRLYWGLRDYGTAKWQGGDLNCSHSYGRNTRGELTQFQKIIKVVLVMKLLNLVNIVNYVVLKELINN